MSKIANFSIFESKNCLKFAKISKVCLRNVNFSSQNWKLSESLKSCQKLNISLWKNVVFCPKIVWFCGKKVKVWSKFVKNVRKKVKISVVVEKKNLNFQSKTEKISKNLLKIVWFWRKKVKVFPKIVKSARKNSNFQICFFFQKTWIFSGKPKFFENLLILGQKMNFLVKKWQFFCKKTEKKKKEIQKSLNLT